MLGHQSVGGPLTVPGVSSQARKTLFFFAGQEFKRRVDGETNRATLPTQAQRAGIVTSAAIPSNFPVEALRGEPIQDPSRATPGNSFGSNILPRQYMSPNGVAIMKIYDTMQSIAASYNDLAANASNTIFQLANFDSRLQNVLRLDYQPSTKHQFAGRALYDRGTYWQPYAGGCPPQKVRSGAFPSVVVVHSRRTMGVENLVILGADSKHRHWLTAWRKSPHRNSPFASS